LDATEVSNSDTASSTSPVLQFSLSSKIEPEIFEREKSKEEALHDIEYWNDLKEALHARHVPSYYKRELLDKLQRLQQRSMSIEEYKQKMELYIMRAVIEEEEELIIAKFLSGLNYNIRAKVELLPYRNFNDLVQMSIKVEQQLLRRPSRKDSPSFSKSDFPKKDFSKEKESTLKSLIKVSDKGESSTNKRGSDIKCFKCLGRGHVAAQCPSKCTIVLKGKDLYTSQEESSSSDSDSSHSSDSQEHSYPNEGKVLMIRRVLNNQPSIPLNDQRENIFHTRCEVLKTTCSLIIDSGSCCNCCSTRLVEKLNLTLLPHPKPYKLH